MNTLDPSLLWAMLVMLVAVAFNAGVMWLQVKLNAKATAQARLDFHTEGERLRQDLREHMAEEQTNMRGLLARLDIIIERQAVIGERVARLER